MGQKLTSAHKSAETSSAVTVPILCLGAFYLNRNRPLSPFVYHTHVMASVFFLKSVHFSICRILRRQDRPTAPPRHGNMQARRGAAARYQRMVAAVDETAHADPIVPLFYPAVRDFAIAQLRFGRCQRRSTVRVPARALLILSHLRTGDRRFPVCPQAVLASGTVPQSCGTCILLIYFSRFTEVLPPSSSYFPKGS